MKQIFQKIWKHLQFRTDYNTQKSLRDATIYFFMTFIVLFAISLLSSSRVLFSSTLFTGSLVHFVAGLYFLNKLTGTYIKKKHRFYHLLHNVFYTLCFAVIFIILAFVAVYPVQPAFEQRQLSLIFALILIVLPMSFSDEIMSYFKKKAFFLALPSFLPKNITVNTSDVLDLATQNKSVIQLLPDYISQLMPKDLISLSPWYLLAVLVALFLAIKLISFILRFIIIILIAWVALKFAGIL